MEFSSEQWAGLAADVLVVVLGRSERVIVDPEAVMNDGDPVHRLAPRLRVADGDVGGLRKLLVDRRQRRFVRMMHGEHPRHIHIRRERQADDVVEMQDVCGSRRIADCP